MNYLNLLWFLPLIIMDVWFLIYSIKDGDLFEWYMINLVISIVAAVIGAAIIIG